MLLSFCSALAYFWWQQHPPTVALPQSAVQLPRSSLPAPLQPRAQRAGASAPPPRAATVAVAPQPNTDGPPLPVLFALTTESIASGETSIGGESTDTPRNVKVANLSNSSDQPLDVTLIVVDVPTQKTSQASVFLAPGGQQTFGPDSGLHLESGNQVTLRSRGYHDLIETVP